MIEGEPIVFVFLGVAFAAVGLYLVLYARRRAGTVRDFARSRGYPWRARDDGSLEEELQEAFRIDEPGCVRTFDRPRDVVSIPGGTLFRAVELLDLNPHASVYDSHQARVAVLLPEGPDFEGIFMVTSDLEVRQRYPREETSGGAGVVALLKDAGVRAPPHPLSLTFMRGRGLAYLQPAVVGSVDAQGLAYLADLAERLSLSRS